MITIEQLYLEDVTSRIITIGTGKELRGACPGCGGDDRFGVFPEQNEGVGSFFCGRYAGSANTGCGKGGDILEYLKHFRGLSYVDACGFLGIEPKNTRRQSHLRYSAPTTPSKAKKGKWVPEDKHYPAEVVDPQKWREHGMKFVNACHEDLLKRNGGVAYLMNRGISLDTIKAFKLGYHEGQESRGKKGQPSYRPWPSWGLRDEKNGSRSRMIALPAGIVIPSIVDGDLHRITVRMNQPDKNGARYHYVKGSVRDLWLTDAGTGKFITAEAELDCLAIISAAGDLIGTVGIGSTGVKPDSRSAKILSRSSLILGSLDFDTPRKNPKTGRIEIPGAQAERWWRQAYPKQHKRWPVPVGKDPGEAFEQGVDLRVWIEAGLGVQEEVVTSAVTESASNDVAKPEESESCVAEMELSNGEVLYLIRFQNGRLTDEGRSEWRRLTEEGKAVFTEKEMAHLQVAIGDMEPQEKLEAGLKAIEVKKMFGGVITDGRKITKPDEVEEIIEKETR
ncbi:MAG: DNA primase [Desulforhopalus sp.]